MKFIPMQQCDLTKTDATTVVAYRDNITISEDSVIDSFPAHLLTFCELTTASITVELALKRIFNKQG